MQGVNGGVAGWPPSVSNQLVEEVEVKDAEGGIQKNEGTEMEDEEGGRGRERDYFVSRREWTGIHQKSAPQKHQQSHLPQEDISHIGRWRKNDVINKDSRGEASWGGPIKKVLYSQETKTAHYIIV